MVTAMLSNVRRRGPQQMRGLEGVGDIINDLTGGELTRAQVQLERLELALKISIAASVIAGLAAIVMLLRR